MIVPIPLALKRTEGVFRSAPDLPMAAIGGDESQRVAHLLRNELRRRYPGSPAAGSETAEGGAAGAATSQEIAGTVAAGDGERASILLVIDPREHSLGEEGYRLTVRPEGIRAVAMSGAGLFYASQTLLQLIALERPAGSGLTGTARAGSSGSASSATSGPAGGTGRGVGDRDAVWEIPAVEIEDRPRFPWRGLHLDVSRHFFPAERIREAIDWIALHKMNRFHWHLTDDQGWRFPVPGRPRLAEVSAWRTEEDGTRHGGMYTRKEILALVAYASERFITVVPEIEMPGHARAALAAYPELSCTGHKQPVPATWGIFEDVFCAGKDETFSFLEEVLDELAALFPGPYIHVGGDECPKARWLACPDCRDRIAAESLAGGEELQSWFIRKIGRHLAFRQRRLIGWDEILEGGLAPDAVVMSWRGMDGGLTAAQAGHDVVMTPAEFCYLDSYQGPRENEPEAFPRDVPLETAYAFDPVPGGLSRDEEAHILGGQANVWTEHMPDWDRVQFMVFPRLSALAEALWSPPERRDLADFRRRMEPFGRLLESTGVRFRMR